MSSQNVAIVRQIYEAAARRDANTVMELYHPSVELDASRLGVMAFGATGGVYHGHHGLRRFFRDWHEAWGSIEYDYEELIDAGESVIAVVNRHARGRTSGVEVERRAWLVWTLRDGMAIRVVWYLTRAEALQAAGLSE